MAIRPACKLGNESMGETKGLGSLSANVVPQLRDNACDRAPSSRAKKLRSDEPLDVNTRELGDELGKLTMADLKTWASTTGNIIGNDRSLPWTAVAPLVPIECSSSTKDIDDLKASLHARLALLGINSEMKNSHG